MSKLIEQLREDPVGRGVIEGVAARGWDFTHEMAEKVAAVIAEAKRLNRPAPLPVSAMVVALKPRPFLAPKFETDHEGDAVLATNGVDGDGQEYHGIDPSTPYRYLTQAQLEHQERTRKAGRNNTEPSPEPTPLPDTPPVVEGVEPVLEKLMEAEEDEPAEPDDGEEQREAEVAGLRETVDKLKADLADALATKKPADVGEDGIPTSFRGLMIDGETAEKFTERMRRRWQALQHLRIDGTKPTENRALPDMTDEEAIELADLETRNSITKWLS